MTYTSIENGDTGLSARTAINEIGTGLDTHIANSGSVVHNLGTLSVQNSNTVSITGGNITGISASGTFSGSFVGTTRPGYVNRITVGPRGTFATLKEAVDWFNSSATGNARIIIDSGDYSITDTITVNNSTYNLAIDGEGIHNTYLNASTGLTNKPMFNLKTTCDLTKFTADGSTLTDYGTQAGEDFILFDTNSDSYHELTNFAAENFKIGVSDTIGTNLFLFNFVIGHCGTGIKINYSGTPGSTVMLDAEVGNFEHCPIGIDLLQGSKSNFLLTSLVFKQQIASDVGIHYDGTTFIYKEIANIMNSTFNYKGSLYDGFDFKRIDGRDANVIIKSNVGTEDKSPHCKMNVVDNTATTTLTTQNLFYKASGVNSKTNIKCSASATSGSFTLTIGTETTGSIAYSSNTTTFANNIKAAIEALTAITTVAVTTVTANKEWNVEFITSGQGYTLPHSATNYLAGVTDITVQPSFYTCKIKCAENRMTVLSKYPFDGAMWINGNVTVNNNSDVINIALKKNNDTLISPFSVRTTTSGQPYGFSIVVYLDEVTLDDYFEIFLSNATSSGKTAILSDLTWYFSSR